MATEIAKAYVQIIPSAQGISGKIKEVLDPEAQSAGQSAGQTIGEQIGSFATKAIAALGIGKMISDSITNGMDFETSMAKASTLFSGTHEELEMLQDDIVRISTETGVAAAQLAEAAYSAESASVPVGNLGDMIESSAKLATAGFTDVDTALSATAKTMNAYGMMSDDVAETQRNMEEVQRILIQTQNKGITTVGELGAALANVTPTAAAAGVGFDQVGAALALMTAQGTPTAQATTQLRSAIAELEKSGTKASDALVAAAEGSEYAGMSFVEMMANGATLGDVMGMLQDYADETGVSMLDLWSSIEGGNAAMSIAKDVSLFDEDLAAMATTADVVGDAYATMSDTAAFKLEQVKNSLKNVGISAFNEFADPLTNALDSVGQIIQNVQPSLEVLGGAFHALIEAVAEVLTQVLGLDEGMSTTEVISEALSAAIQTVADVIQFLADNLDVIIPLVTAVVAGFMAFQTVQFVVGFINGLVGAFEAAGVAIAAISNPIGIVIAVVAALAAGVLYLWNTNEDFRNAVGAIWDGICGAIRSAGEAIASVWDSVKTKAGELKNAIFEKWENIKSKTSEVWNNVKGKTSEAWNNIKSTISEKISAAKEYAGQKLDNIKAAFEQNGGGIKGIASATWTAIKEYYKTGFDVINTLTGGKLTEIKDKFSARFSEIRDGIREKMNAARDAFSEVLGNIRNAIQEKIGNALSWGWDLVSNFARGIMNGIGNVIGAARSVANAVASYIHFSEPDVGPLSNFHTFMPDMIDQMVEGIRKGIPEVASAMNGLSSSMVPNTAGGTTNNMGGVTMNIYGAQGQDINELAQLIEDRLVRLESRRMAAFI